MGFFLLELQGHQIVKPICFHLLAVTDLQEVNQSCFRSQEPQQHQAASKCSVHPQALQYYTLVNLVVLYYSVILNHQSFIHVCLHPQTLLQYHVTNKEFFHLLALQSHWLVLKIYFYYQTRQHQQKINSKPVCFSSSSTTSNSTKFVFFLKGNIINQGETEFVFIVKHKSIIMQ